VDDPTVVLELNDIKANLAMERELELEASGGKTSLLIYVTITSFIFYYGTTLFFKRSGISNPFLISVAVNVGMTIPGIWKSIVLGVADLQVSGSPRYFLTSTKCTFGHSAVDWRCRHDGLRIPRCHPSAPPSR
jgi:hypothetical protein